MSYETDNHIGQYRIVRKIGAGGMGAVYECEHVLLGRRAAIKTLLPLLSLQKEVVDRFFNEARATSAISDPGVVQVFDFGYHVDGTAYIVMELLEGEGLDDRLERTGRMSPATALRFARQLASALAAAHAQGIVHRDLKPENVFLIRDPEAQDGERAKLLDFGVCKLSASDGRVTQSGVMLGTPVYMSPEQCQGAGRVDHRSDIYGLGCVMFHMLTGRVPFDGDGTGELIVAHLQHEAPKPSELVPTLPPSIDALIGRCLAKAPADRYQSMGELLTAIADVLPEVRPESGQVPVAIAPATPLAAGFRSRFDANALPATARLRLGLSPVKVPTTLQTANGQTVWPPPRRSGARTLVAVMASAAVVALAAAAVWLGRGMPAEAAVAEPARVTAPVTAVVEPPAPAPVVVEPIETGEPLDATEPVAIQAAATVAAPVKVAPAPAARPMVRAKQIKTKPPVRRAAVERRPAVVQRAPVRAQPPAPAVLAASREDLYDIR